MKPCLPLAALATLITLSFATPASAQYMWIDVNGDGVNPCISGTGTPDALGPSVTSIDIWLSTNLNGNGSAAVCPTGEALTINSYTFTLSSNSGGVAYGAWTDAMGFTIAAGGPSQNSTDYFIGRGSANIQSPGTYKLGSLGVTVTGNPTLSIVAHSTIDVTSLTSFGSQCQGQDFNNTMRYGENQDEVAPGDWNDVCGTSAPIAVSETTWGKIKKNYSGD